MNQWITNHTLSALEREGDDTQAQLVTIHLTAENIAASIPVLGEESSDGHSL